MLESFRLGIVPIGSVKEFTFGRDKEISEVKNWITNNEEGGTLKIVGEYGSGKTHLLELIRSLALEEGWAVAMVYLDPQESPLHNPKKIYANIIRSFQFRNEKNLEDFREFLRTIARSRDYNKLNGHSYLEKAIIRIRQGNDDENFWEWIEGSSNQLGYRPMYNYSTSANIYCYILSGVGWATRNILGLKGLIILFDEVESVDSYWYTSYSNNKIWNFLKGLVFFANNKEELLNENISWSQLSYEGWYGEKTKLQYCGHSTIRFLWKKPCYVKIIFAFVPPEILGNNELLELLREITQIEIENIDEKSLKKIFDKISSLYSQAYNVPEINTDVFKKIPNDKTRRFIKGLIEALDLIRFHPDRKIEELLR